MTEIEYCKTCGKPVVVMCQQNTGYCSQRCKPEEEPEEVPEDYTDHWVDYGKPEGYICSCPVGQDHERPRTLEQIEDE